MAHVLTLQLKVLKAKKQLKNTLNKFIKVLLSTRTRGEYDNVV